MQVKLEPDVIEAVKRLQAAGMAGSVDQIVNRALRLNLDLPELRRRRDELKRMILEGVESLERGECYDADEVFDEILADLEQAAARS